MIWISTFTVLFGLFLLRNSNISIIVFLVIIFYYNLQLDYFFYMESFNYQDMMNAYLFYYASVYGFLIFVLTFIGKQPYVSPQQSMRRLSHHISVIVFVSISVGVFVSFIGFSVLVLSSRPAMVDFGYLITMLLFTSAFICYNYGYKKSCFIQLIILIFLSKILFFTFLIFLISIKEDLRLHKVFFISSFLLCLFVLWGVWQDNMNYEANSNSVNQFVTAAFFFNHVVEGGSSIVTQLTLDTTPDLGWSFLKSGLLRLIPGFLLRDLGISLVPEDVSKSIVISGIESSIIHFGYLGPIFFGAFGGLLILLFNGSKSLFVKFICCSSLLFFIRSGTYSFVNNLVVMIFLFLLFFSIRACFKQIFSRQFAAVNV